VTETRQETSHEVRLDLTDLMLLSPKNPFMAYKYTGEPDSRPFFFLRVFVGMYSVFSNQSSLIKKVRKADAQTVASIVAGGEREYANSSGGSFSITKRQTDTQSGTHDGNTFSYSSFNQPMMPKKKQKKGKVHFTVCCLCSLVTYSYIHFSPFCYRIPSLLQFGKLPQTYQEMW
jgi:hypothetical protein